MSLCAADTTLGAEFLSCSGKIREDIADKTTEVFAELKVPDGRQIKFTAEGRSNIAAETLDEIRWGTSSKSRRRRGTTRRGRHNKEGALSCWCC